MSALLAFSLVQEKCGASTVVDSATLTGACMVALGGEIAGVEDQNFIIIKANRPW